MGESTRRFEASVPDNPRLHRILEAAKTYSTALLRLYEQLDILSSYAGPPEHLLARLVVAELVGGVALPAVDFPVLGVFGPDGERIYVFPISLQKGFDYSLGTQAASRDADLVAIVVFDRGSPVAVHLIPRERAAAVTEAFTAPDDRPVRWLPVSLFAHSSFVLDPIRAAALGVTTYDLTAPSSP